MRKSKIFINFSDKVFAKGVVYDIFTTKIYAEVRKDIHI